MHILCNGAERMNRQMRSDISNNCLSTSKLERERGEKVFSSRSFLSLKSFVKCSIMHFLDVINSRKQLKC